MPQPSSSLPEDPNRIPGHVLARLHSIMVRDRPRLGRDAVRLNELIKQKKAAEKDLTLLGKRFLSSLELVSERRRLAPALRYQEELPIAAKRQEIAEVVKNHQVTVIAGSTGSGKTTQLPKICLEMGRGIYGSIGITQPRRIAAMSVASRVAHELDEPLGSAIGFQIRFMAKTKPTTLVKFMTDGILLNEIQGDRELLQYDTVILDEAHERNLDTDLLLGCLKRILAQRPEMRLIVSSATLDIDRFCQYFDNAPAIILEGRIYPVEVRYSPPDEEEDDDPDLAVMILHAVEDVVQELPAGDILVFLPGEADIRETADTLTRSGPPGLQILPLFSRLTPEEQQRVFQPTKQRKIILATNIAETSLTIPGIRAVIDSGLARLRRSSDKASVERLQIEKISQASAEQRKGRAGRVAPGMCIRLYSEKDFLKRPEFTDPEIRRASLASVILRLRHLGLGPVEDFPFLDPPQLSRIREGYRELSELGALDSQGDITGAGKRMASLPVEPRFARILLEAKKNGVLEPALIIVSMLSVQDPRERPLAKQGEADKAHRRFLHGKSDFLGWLALWKFYEDALEILPSKSQARKFCRQNFLNYLRMQEWRDICRQTSEIMAANAEKMEKFPQVELKGDKDGGYARLHKALLAGLLGRTGKRTEEGDYLGARGVRFHLWPGSGIIHASREKRDASREAGDKPSEIKRKSLGPAWVMGAELAETSRLFARGVAEIDPLWIEELAGPLAKRSYSEPYYDERGGFVRAREKVEVYGLPVVEGRRVHYGGINPAEARCVFIRQALVEGKLRTALPFFKENQALREAIAEIAHKARQPLMAGEETLYRFYDERLPEHVHNDKALVRYVQDKEKEGADFLRLTRDYLMENPPDGITRDRFPPALVIDNRSYPLSYRFLPGHDEDGVTMTVPVADLPNLPEWRLQWLVPGLLGAKVAELLRSLPKSLRRELSPVSDTAQQLPPLLGKPDKPLVEAVADACFRLTGCKIPFEAWKQDDLPAFLQLNIRAVDPAGRTVGMGRNIADLAARLKLAARNAFASMDKEQHQQSGLTAWDFGDLPERIEIRGGAGASAFPALVDEGKTAGIVLFHAERLAARAMIGGFRRIVALTLHKDLAKLAKDIRLSTPAAALSQMLGGGSEALRTCIIRAALDEAFATSQPVRSHRLFLQRIAAGKGKLFPLAMELRSCLEEAFVDASRLIPHLDKPPTPAHAESYRDMLKQIESLLSPHILDLASAEQIRQLPRYLNAAETRYQRLGYALGKDKQRLKELLPYRERYSAAAGVNLQPEEALALLAYRWLLEEWRIGLFSQEPGLKILASAKKLDSAWEKFIELH